MERPDVETAPSQLRQTVERHQACYVVWPDWALVEGRRVQIGFELDLCANVERPGEGPCVEIYEELKQIAMSVLPHNPGETEFDVLPFDNSLHENVRRNFRPEIVLAFRILHKRGFDKPVDNCEKDCLRQIESKLRQLGFRRAN